jgi:uncharacterized protein (DUF433 family)
MGPIVENQHIERTPGVCGGKARIAGHRIRVQDIYICHELNGMSPDEIVQTYPSISLADVHAALAYYWDHREEIQQELKADEELVESLRKIAGPGLIERLHGKERSDSAPFSPG